MICYFKGAGKGNVNNKEAGTTCTKPPPKKTP